MRRDRVTTRQPRNQTPMVRRRDISGPKGYPRKRDPLVFWRRSAGPAKGAPDGQAPWQKGGGTLDPLGAKGSQTGGVVRG